MRIENLELNGQLKTTLMADKENYIKNKIEE